MFQLHKGDHLILFIIQLFSTETIVKSSCRMCVGDIYLPYPHWFWVYGAIFRWVLISIERVEHASDSL